MDLCGGREFRVELTSYLKKRLNDPSSPHKIIKDVAAQRSSSNNLIQLADMVCGAVARAEMKTKKNATEFHQIIKHRQIWIRRWPE